MSKGVTPAIAVAWDAYVDAGCKIDGATFRACVQRFDRADRWAVVRGVRQLMTADEWARFRLGCMEVWVRPGEPRLLAFSYDDTDTADTARLRAEELRHCMGMRNLMRGNVKRLLRLAFQSGDRDALRSLRYQGALTDDAEATLAMHQGWRSLSVSHIERQLGLLYSGTWRIGLTHSQGMGISRLTVTWRGQLVARGVSDLELMQARVGTVLRDTVYDMARQLVNASGDRHWVSVEVAATAANVIPPNVDRFDGSWRAGGSRGWPGRDG